MRQPLDAGEDWSELLRWACRTVSSTPEEIISALSISMPRSGSAGGRLLAFLARRLGEEYGVRVTIAPSIAAYHLEIRRTGAERDMAPPLPFPGRAAREELGSRRSLLREP